MAHSSYKSRMNHFVAAVTLYAAGFPIGVNYFSAPDDYYLVYFSTLILLFCLASGLDAVYDTLRDKLDSQHQIQDL